MLLQTVSKTLILAGAITLTLVSLPAWAGCVSDCKDEYESEIDSCKLLHDDPDDADWLKMCIESAKDEYESCKHECES